MIKNMMKLAAALALAGLATAAGATTLTEDFEGPFPAWESGWLGTNSNLQNVYGVHEGRGNNPDGLWIADGNMSNGGAFINFNPAFGSTITSFSIDITSWTSGLMFHAYDMNGAELVNTLITSYAGAYSDPGSYQTIAFTSTHGVSGFSIPGGNVEGYTSIDNVVVTTGRSDVPEPASLGLLALGAAGLAATRRKKA